MIGVDYGVLNQKGSPSWFSDIYANIPTAGYKGRMFISIDTYAFYRDTGTGWDLIGGPGTGTITGSGTSGQVSYFNGSSTLAGSNNLFWDNTNGRLGIGTATPGAPLDIHGTGTQLQLNGTGVNNSYLIFQNAGTSKWRIGNTYGGGSNLFSIFNNNLGSTPFQIDGGTNTSTFFNPVVFNNSGIFNIGLTLKDGTYIVPSNGNLGLSSNGGGLTFLTYSGGTIYSNNLNFTTNAANTYTLPNATGTLALTSNLSSYVPYTGATQSVDLGYYNISNFITQIGQDTDFKGGYVNFKQCTSVNSGNIGYTNIFVLNSTQFGINYMQSSGLNKTAIFDASSITTGYVRTFTFPDTSGTLALTSSLSSYLPLTGGTLTGQLYINPTNTGTTGLDVASDTIRFRSDNLEGFKRQLLITMGSGTLIQFQASGFGGTYGTDIAFYTSSASGVNSSPAIYMTGGNSVGIGTGSPNTAGANIGLSLNDLTAASFEINNASARAFYTYTDATRTIIGEYRSVYIAFRTADTERMRITSSGNLLIGTTSSTASMNQTGILQVSGGIRSTSGLLTIFELGTIAQNSTITQSISYNGFYLITNGGNNSALFMITRAGGSRGCQLIFSTNSNLDITCGTTTEPAAANYLKLWMSNVGELSIKNVNAYTGPYSMNPIATQ
jgi:hypothetical protein